MLVRLDRNAYIFICLFINFTFYRSLRVEPHTGKEIVNNRGYEYKYNKMHMIKM
jgi:hypothetical protein